MSAANPLTNARSHIDALGRLLDEATARQQPAGEIADEAMMHLREATRVIESMKDDDAAV